MALDHIPMKIFFLLLATGLTTLRAQLPFTDPAYKLVVFDDFNGNRVDTSLWQPIAPWNQCGNTTGEHCPEGALNVAYRKWDPKSVGGFDYSNTKVNRGTLKLYTRREDYKGLTYCWPDGVFKEEYIDYQYTTAMLFSKKRYQYGYYEIRFWLPAVPPGYTYQGFGPNFWLWGVEKPANHWSEIDIFEIFGYNPANDTHHEYTTNIHYQGDSSYTKQTDFMTHGGISGGEWHTAGMEWTPKHVHFYLDGRRIKEVTSPIPFDSLVPMHIFIDINSPTVGPCIDFALSDSRPTFFPYVYEIDYVKVWQKKVP